MRDDRRFVVVSGLPGSGKSTLGRTIATALARPFIDKDDFLERSLERHATVDAELRFRLSRDADDEMRSAAEASQGAVLVSFWRREEVSPTAGTPTEWLRALPNVVEVYCTCSVAAAADRFLSRARHHGHGDAARSRADLVRQFDALVALGPIGLGSVIPVDTEQRVDIDALLGALAALGARSAPP